MVDRPAIPFRRPEWLLPRMADFGAFGEAVGRAFGWPDGTVFADYNDNRREATLTQLEDSLVASALRRYANDVQEWTGTASELLRALTRRAGKRAARSAHWPKSPGWFTNELRRIAPQLRMHGVSATFERNRESRVIALRYTTPLEK
jgi:hypothetical protein